MLLLRALLISALAVPAAQTTQATSEQGGFSPAVPQHASDPSTTAVVPQQIRRAEPPSKDASAADLEESGDQLRAQNDYADAIDYYRVAMSKADSAALHNKVGIAYLGLLRHDEARKEFKRSIKMDRNYAEPYNNLGVIDYVHHNYGSAIKQYHKAIRLHDTSASFHSNLGTALFAEKDYDAAMSEYARALQLDPDVFERRSRGGVSLHMVNPDEIGRYDYVIAKMYATAGNPERCLLYLRKALEEGYRGIKDVYKEREFERIRKDPRFVALMNSKMPQISTEQ